jgi:hypothetical protein
MLVRVQPIQSEQIGPEIFQTTSYTTSYATNYATTTLTITETSLNTIRWTMYIATSYGASYSYYSGQWLIAVEKVTYTSILSTSTDISSAFATYERASTTAFTVGTMSSTVLFYFGIAEATVVAVLVAIVVVAVFLLGRTRKRGG